MSSTLAGNTDKNVSRIFASIWAMQNKAHSTWGQIFTAFSYWSFNALSYWTFNS
ncbi:hypothetical protein T03_16573 [Trichinella britovi]|uniref:Uncharacterized protein n=2 Tax=Trichinella TaxID=6333 RepID=A0A0V1DE63_TRIBR|nr:hypothetical protein T03_16573 [Trichinella britovi]